MKTQTTLPQITKHFFSKKSDPDYTISVCAPTKEEAHTRDRMSSPEEFTFSYTEKINYLHAQIAFDTCTALGSNWKAVPISDEYKESGFYLKRADGLTLFFSPPSYSHRNKFHVSYSRPRHNGSWFELYEKDASGYLQKVSDPSANLSETKTADQLAKDISRRILPEAEKVHKLALERIAYENSAKDAQQASALRVSVAVNKPLQSKYQGKAGEKETSGHIDGIGTWQAEAGGRVSFSLYSLPIDKAEKLAALLASFGE